MIAKLDIENAKTQEVKTLVLQVTELIEDAIIKFDVSNLTEKEMEMLKLAISENKNTNYTDVELFYIDDDEIPYFGPDYNFYIKDDSLVGIYNRNIYKRKGAMD